MGGGWEYKFLVGAGVGSSLRDGAGVDHGPPCEALLNRLGDAGWEVCSHTYAHNSQPSLIVGRRRPAEEEVGDRAGDV